MKHALVRSNCPEFNGKPYASKVVSKKENVFGIHYRDDVVDGDDDDDDDDDDDGDHHHHHHRQHHLDFHHLPSPEAQDPGRTVQRRRLLQPSRWLWVSRFPVVHMELLFVH